MNPTQQEQKLLAQTKELLTSAMDSSRLEDLRNVIRYHDHRYYVLSEPQITDQEYDALFQKLKDWEHHHPADISTDSPTQRIASSLTDSFPPVRHLTPMLSLENTYNAADLLEVDTRIRGYTREDETEYCVEPKFDGSSIALVYEGDHLVRAATRGDGDTGEDITANARAIPSIPLLAPFSRFGIFRIEIRGEILIRRDTLEKLNRERSARGEKVFQNARNTASGSLRLKDPAEVARRGLEAMLYHVSYAEKTDGSDALQEAGATHFDQIQLLNRCGFKTPGSEINVCRGTAAVQDYIRHWEEKRHHFHYDTDGMVIKVNRLQDQRKCGSTTHHPRWAMAYKFPANQAQAKLLQVEYQVGRTGAVTPVAKIEPVSLSGVTISSISLHNAEFIREKDIRLGDTVIVERAGEVIPYIAGVVESVRRGNEEPITFITHCPSCNSVLVRPEEEAIWRCDNAACPAQTLERIVHFVHKDAMDIEGLGRQIITDFMDKGFLHSPADIYRLPYDEIRKGEGWGEKSIQNLEQSIELSKKRPMWRLLNALGIRLVGSGTAKDMAAHIHHLMDLAGKRPEDFMQIEGIGPKVAQSIASFFSQEGNVALLNELAALGLNMENRAEDQISRSQKLQGKTFLFTGTLKQFTRDRAKEMVEENGGRLLSGVSAQLQYLVAGENAGSKLTKARQISTIQVLSEEEFLAMIS